MNKIVLLVYFAFFLSLFSVKSQIIYDNNGLILGRDTFTSCYFGDRWSIEYYDGGLNFFRPWPLSNFGNYKLFIDKTGKIGVHKKPSYPLDVKGSVSCLSHYSQSSDIRYKSNIVELSDCITKLMCLKGKQYQKLIFRDGVTDDEFELMKKEGKIPIDVHNTTSCENIYKDEIGFLANELKEIFPELVFEDENGILSVNYLGLLPVIVNSMKEQNLKLSDQKMEIDNLKAEIQKYINNKKYE